MRPISLIKGWLLVLSALLLAPVNLFAWTNGELLIWMDADRGHALEAIARKFEKDFGLKVTIETPEKITDSFPIAAQMARGPDIVVWAHDKVGEWADAGLIAPIQVSEELGNKFFLKAWQAVLHSDWIWGYPLALETATLIYNKKLLDSPPPTQLSELVSLNDKIKKEHPGVTTILWDYKSSYYSWGILASAGAYVYAKNGPDYNLKNVGIGNRGAVKGLSKIVALVQAGVLPKSVSYSEVENLMGQGKLAMMISGPWAWSNLIKNGIDFGVAPIPGVDENVGRPFVGVTVAYLNRSSPNQDLIKEFLERYALTEEALSVMYQAKPTGVPALISLYEKLAKDNPLLRELKAAVEYGEVMPNIPQMGRFFSSVSGALQIATEGRASAKAALQEAETNMLHH
ncbi:MAG: maltose/maltodextrin ABC transporter substrate-binding protein MalE [Verrucomicrobia bacterium]|nr:maltose/maltodextrin ABC transporter substrate-binding protein MalE [Verrucomicrobiota bacterium]